MASRLTVKYPLASVPILRRTRRAGSGAFRRLGYGDKLFFFANQLIKISRQTDKAKLWYGLGGSGFAQQCALGNYTTMLVLLILTIL